MALRKQKEKSRADRFAYSDNAKGRSSGVILVVASQFASDTYPKCGRSQLSTKILLGSAPAELVNGFPNF